MDPGSVGLKIFKNVYIINLFWGACGILVPQPGIEHIPLHWKHSLNHWTTRVVPITCNFNSYLLI